MKIKIIWNFRGEDGLETAKHHAIHVKEFCDKEVIPFYNISFELINDMHATAFVVVDKVNIVTIRDVLKPHRAEVFEA